MKNFIYAITMAFILFGCKQKPELTADAIYFGGDILTMKGDTPEYVEAIAIKDGKIQFVGLKNEAMEFNGDSTKLIDLEGKTLLPGFIDAHGHVYLAGFQALAANLLPPPDGKGSNVETLIELTKEWADKNKKAIGKVGWIIGFGYDDAQLEEKRHPVADELDKISTEYPVLFLHQSGHLGVMNHKALEMSGYNANTPNPPGGVIRRVAGNNEPNGVLEELAMFIPVFKLFDTFDEAANKKIAKAGLEAYIRFGYTTAQEGRATRDVTETWKELADAGELKIDVVSYPDILKEFPYMKEVGVQADYKNHFRIGGVKINLDGSPQGKTAWLTEPYVVPPPGEKPDYKGYPAFPNEENVVSLVDSAFKYNWQVLAHCNGDAAGDQFIRAVRRAGNQYGNKDRRSVMIHAQTVREDQLDSMKTLGIIPSFFGMHTFYWGDWHRDETLGKERAYRISPAVSALNRGMIFTEHHDAPVALPSSIMILHTAVNRTSRSGDIIGKDQKISPYIALKSITDWAAYQHFEENIKGTLEKGKLADMVILDKNPLKIDAPDIINIKVLETIKEGNTIYKN